MLRPTATKSWLSGENRYVKSTNITIIKAIHPLNLLSWVGAPLLSFAKNWESVTKDSGVLKPLLSEGIKLGYATYAGMRPRS